MAGAPWMYHYRQITLEWPILHSRAAKSAGRSLLSLFPVMLCKYCCNPLILSLAVCFTSFATEKHFSKSPRPVCFAACVVFRRFGIRHLSTGGMKFPPLLINAARGVPLEICLFLFIFFFLQHPLFFFNFFFFFQGNLCGWKSSPPA